MGVLAKSHYGGTKRLGVKCSALLYLQSPIRTSMCRLKPKFHYADFPETSPSGEVSGEVGVMEFGLYCSGCQMQKPWPSFGCRIMKI